MIDEGHLFLPKDWSQVAQAFQFRRTLQEKGQIRTETVYDISSLSSDQAFPERLLPLVRAHWAIENRLHWRRDVTSHCGHVDLVFS